MKRYRIVEKIKGGKTKFFVDTRRKFLFFAFWDRLNWGFSSSTEAREYIEKDALEGKTVNVINK